MGREEISRIFIVLSWKIPYIEYLHLPVPFRREVIQKGVAMKRIWWVVLLWAGCAMLHSAVHASAQDDGPGIAEQMNKLFFEWDRLDRPGGSVVVIKDGEVVFQQAYGLASLEHKIANSTSTVFDVTSLAEPFTALAVAELESQGALRLDEAVRTYLPDLDAGLDSITVRHLLHHTSGLRDWRAVHQLSGYYLEDVITARYVMTQIQKQHVPEHAPGSRFQYSCTNYTLLAQVVESVTGMSFRDWAWEHLLRPGKMTRSMIRDRYGEPIEGSATAYSYWPDTGYQKGTENLSAPGAHCLYSSVDNLAKFLIKLDADTPDDRARRQLLLKRGTLDNGETSRYGYGLYRDTYKGLTRYRSSGQWQGFGSVLHLYPDQRFYIVILSNWISSWVNPRRTAVAIADIYLEDAFQVEDTNPSPSPAEPSDFQPDPSSYQRYTGDYRLKPGILFAISEDQGRLVYQISSARKLPLTEVSPGRFVMDGFAYSFSFEADENGACTGCQMEVPGGDIIHAPKIKLVNPSVEELQRFTGDYHCQELRTSYTVVLANDSLSILHDRTTPMQLKPETQNHFMTSSQVYGLVRFTDDDQGNPIELIFDPLNMVCRKTKW